jgi:hypothetical protein
MRTVRKLVRLLRTNREAPAHRRLLPRKEDAMKPFHRILVATDFTLASESALAEALAMAKGDGTELRFGDGLRWAASP